jgi:hypothetical protein
LSLERPQLINSVKTDVNAMNFFILNIGLIFILLFLRA